MSVESIAADGEVDVAAAPRGASGTGAKGHMSRQAAVDTLAGLDLLAITIAGVLPALIYQHGAGPGLNWPHVGQASVIAGILTVLCLKSGDAYDASRVHDLPVQPGRIAANVAISIGAMMGLGLPSTLSQSDLAIWLVVWFGAGAGLVVVLHTLARRVLRRWTLAGRFDRRVAVFGAGPIARRIHDHLAANDLGVGFAGVWDDRKDEARVDPLGLDIVGRLPDLVAAARRGEVDQIIIALPQAADGRIADIARRFDETQASVHIVTHIASDLVGKPRKSNVSNIGHVGLLDVRTRAETETGWRSLLAIA